jgi:hypothetical protein
VQNPTPPPGAAMQHLSEDCDDPFDAPVADGIDDDEDEDGDVDAMEMLMVMAVMMGPMRQHRQKNHASEIAICM